MVISEQAFAPVFLNINDFFAIVSRIILRVETTFLRPVCACVTALSKKA